MVWSSSESGLLDVDMQERRKRRQLEEEVDEVDEVDDVLIADARETMDSWDRSGWKEARLAASLLFSERRKLKSTMVFGEILELMFNLG